MSVDESDDLADISLSEPEYSSEDSFRTHRSGHVCSCRSPRSARISLSSSSSSPRSAQSTNRVRLGRKAYRNPRCMSDRFTKLPTCTSKWNVNNIESLGIFYQKDYLKLPSDVLDLFFKKTGLFGPIQEDQKIYVERLQNSLTFSCSSAEIMCPEKLEIILDKFLSELNTNIIEIRNQQQVRYKEYDTTLDYNSVRSDLMNAANGKKAEILQTMRLQLTGPLRDSFMSDCKDNDLLGCIGAGIYQDAVLSLLSSSDCLVREEAAMLLNACASCCAGRTYLAQNDNLIKTLMNSLNEEESVTREYVLGTLQKLSKRRDLQTVMIDVGLIEWLVDILDKNSLLSINVLESAVNLLMNLCLKSSAKKQCIKDPAKTVQVLSNLLCHENPEVESCVSVALKCILTTQSIFEKSNAMVSEDIVQCCLKEQQPEFEDEQTEFNKRIQIIMKQLTSTEDEHPGGIFNKEKKQCTVRSELAWQPSNVVSKLKHNQPRKTNTPVSINPFPFALVEDFIRNIEHVIKFQCLHVFERKLPVPKEVLTDMFKGLTKMCHLVPVPGSVFRYNAKIRGFPVQSEVDVGIKCENHLDQCRKPITGDCLGQCCVPAPIVTIAELENLISRGGFDGEQEEGETAEEEVVGEFEEEDVKTRRISSENANNDPVKPDIYHDINSQILGQHGAELLLQIFCGNAFGRATKYFPGTLIVGTEVIFTLLEMKARHLEEMASRKYNIQNEAYIHYSKPMDLLKKEDRDILLESFVRLNNVKSR